MGCKDTFIFYFIGDGIFDKLTNLDIFDLVWKCKPKGIVRENIHELCGIITDSIMKLSLKKYTSDNITCIFICFQNFVRKMNEEFYEKKIIKSIGNVAQMGGEIDLSGVKNANDNIISKK